MPVCVPEDARRIMPDVLRDFTTEMLRKVHLPADDAALVARYLVDVDLRGVVSHGTLAEALQTFPDFVFNMSSR